MTDAAGLVARRRWSELAAKPLDDTAVEECDAQRVLALLADGVEEGLVELTAAAEADLRKRLQRRALSAVTLDSRLLATVAALTSAGVEIRLLKGAAVSRLDYERPDHRPYGDVDILVRGEAMAAAVEVLEGHGFERHFAEPFPGHDATVGKGVAMGGTAGVVVDLHRTLALGYYGTRLPVAGLWDVGEPVDVEGTPMTALSRQNRFLHSALHGALSQRTRLTDSLDLVRIWTGASEPLSLATLVERAERWGCGGRIASAVLAAEANLPGELDADLVAWACNRRRSHTEWIVDRAYHGRLAHSRARTVSAVFGLPSWRSRLSVTVAEVRGRGSDD